METTELILTELRQLRGDSNEFALRVEGRIAALETDNHAVLGNGQPGRMATAEADIRDLQRWKWKMVGITTGASMVVSVLVSVVAWWLE